MPILTLPELEILLPRFAGIHIGVIGDYALDCYWTVDRSASQPSVETGKPTLPVLEQRYAAGAAGNVVTNLVALGCGRVSAFGIVGRDPWGAELQRILRATGADTAGLMEQERDWATITYVKPHIGGIEQSRTDFGDFNTLHDDTADRLIAGLERSIPGLDLVVINAQARSGIHNAYLRQRLSALIASRPAMRFIVDSRDPQSMYAGCALKINEIEAARYCRMPDAATADLSHPRAFDAAKTIFSERDKPVFMTRGREGIVIHDAAGITEIPAIRIRGDVDTTGAGDAALAGIAATLASGGTSVLAAAVGNLAAAVCVGKLHQTGTARPEELRALMNSENGGTDEHP